MSDAGLRAKEVDVHRKRAWHRLERMRHGHDNGRMDQFVTPLGIARHQYGDRPFGTGKSTFLLNLALHDALAGRGFCLIDPHGCSPSTPMAQI
jgi:hypothetical protein